MVSSGVTKANMIINDEIQALAARVIDPMNLNSKRDLNALMVLVIPKLKFFIWKFFKNDDETLDVLHDVLEKICKKIHTFNPVWRFTTWAYRIATNESLLKIQSNKKRNEVCIDDIYTTVANNHRDTSKEILEKEEDFYSLYSVVICEILDLDFDREFKAQNKENIKIFKLKEINRMKIRDIAERYHLPENTVKTKLRAMRTVIRERVQAKCPELCDKFSEISNF